MRQVIKKILTIITLERWILVDEGEETGESPKRAITLASRSQVLDSESREDPPPEGPDAERGVGK